MALIIHILEIVSSLYVRVCKLTKSFSFIALYHLKTMHSGIVLRLLAESSHAIMLQDRVPQVLLALSIIGGIAVWRMWALTKSPKCMQTHEPSDLPYYIPGKWQSPHKDLLNYE